MEAYSLPVEANSPPVKANSPRVKANSPPVEVNSPRVEANSPLAHKACNDLFASPSVRAPPWHAFRNYDLRQLYTTYVSYI
eukprot:674340-Prorocentrum_minimum.AAC.1